MKPIDLLNKLYDLNYSKNTFEDKKHEKLVKNTLENFGLTQTEDSEIINILKNKENKNKLVKELVGNFIFVEQPFNSQKSPDFIVCVDGFIIWIECKSGKELVWNSGYPIENTLYVFSSKKTNNTIIFLGCFAEIVTKNENFEERYKEYTRLINEHNTNLFKQMFDTESFSIYSRKMLNDYTKYHEMIVRNDFFKKTIEVYTNLLK